MKKNQLGRIGLVVLAGGALLFLAACGGGGKAAVSSQDESAEAQSLAAEIDAGQSAADFEEDTGDITDQENDAVLGEGVALAPPDPVFPMAVTTDESGLIIPRAFVPFELMPKGTVDKSNVVVEYYNCGALDKSSCRVKNLDVPFLFPERHWLESAEAQTTSPLVYSSSLTGTAGDLNLTRHYAPKHPALSPAAYVSVSFSVVRSPQGQAPELSTTGTGVYSEDTSNPYYSFTWTTTGFPESVKVCREDVIEPAQVQESVSLDAATRIRETLKTFPDGVTAYFHRSVKHENGMIYTSSFRLNRKGGELSVRAVINPGATPRCPLDDTGTINVTRTFPLDADLPEGVTVPVREVTVINRQGLTDQVSSKLTLSNGQTLTRTLTRKVESPASCADWEAASPKPAIVVHVTGELYRGGTLDLTVTRDESGLNITGTRTQPDGGYSRIEVDRYRDSEETGITAENYDADNTLRAEVSINLVGHRQGRGQIVIYSPEGETRVILLKFTCDGKGYWYPSDDPSDKHEFGKEKFLKYGVERYL
ncbi:MAG: hypothetical protein PHE84_05885 [bacterium]|nr:hypothetical protein [bacterium]